MKRMILLCMAMLLSAPGWAATIMVFGDSLSAGYGLRPGEGWVDIQKVWAGAGGSDPAALLGQWLTLDLWGFAGQVSKVDALTEIVDGKAQSSGGRTKCWFETTPQGTVRCQSFMREYRFTPPYGRGASAASSMVMKNNGEPSTKVENTLVLVQRVVDGYGVVSGTGNR